MRCQSWGAKNILEKVNNKKKSIGNATVGRYALSITENLKIVCRSRKYRELQYVGPLESAGGFLRRNRIKLKRKKQPRISERTAFDIVNRVNPIGLYTTCKKPGDGVCTVYGVCVYVT